MKRFRWQSMSLSRRVLLSLLLVLFSAAVQIAIAQLQNLRVFTPLKENAEQIQTISQFLHQTEQCMDTLEEYHWEYGDASQLMLDVDHCLQAASAHLSSLGSIASSAGENTRLLYHAVRTTYPYFTDQVEAIEQALLRGEETLASRVYYDTAAPCGQYLVQYSRELLEETILDSHDLVFALSSTGRHYSVWLLVSSLAALLSTLLFFLYLRSLLFSISDLSRASESIREGNFHFPDVDDHRQDEIGHLATTFNQMKQSMKRQMELLQEKSEMERQLRIKETEALELQNLIEAGRLQLLRSQIHPHFLFNTLSVISYQAQQENAPETVNLLGSLSHFFRYTLGSNETHVPLSQEVLIIQDFYAIYHARFGDRIELRWDLDPEVELTETLIPSFLIQPLVENAFHHGLAPKEEGGWVAIAIRNLGQEEGGGLLVRVTDNGVGIAPEALQRLETCLQQTTPPQEHIGLYNVASRLRLAGDAYHLNIRNRTDGGTSVSIRLPLLLSGDELEDAEPTETSETATDHPAEHSGEEHT